MPCTILVTAHDGLQTRPGATGAYWSLPFLPPCDFDAFLAR